MDTLKETQDALVAMLASFLDLLNGYPERELHEPPKLTIQRAMRVLPVSHTHEIDLPEEYLP